MESSKKEAIVHRNPHVMNGALVFAGARVPVKILMDHLAAGDSLDEFLEGPPGVSREQAVTYLEMAREAAEGASGEDGRLRWLKTAGAGDGGGRAR
jgi:uncharacterized protein (DUF433 family)